MNRLETKLHVYNTQFNYIYIFLFLVHILLIMVAGSYINMMIFCLVWTIYFVRLHSHSVVITVLVAFSVTFQLYSLSRHTQESLFASPERELTCYMSGHSNLGELSLRKNKCSNFKFAPFTNREQYDLVQHPDMELLHTENRESREYEPRNCSTLGIHCFSWSIRVQEISARLFEPCWDLVEDISVLDGDAVFLVNTRQLQNTREHQLVPLSNTSFVLVDNVETEKLAVENGTTIFAFVDSNRRPDMYTRFIVIPRLDTKNATMRTRLSTSCSTNKHRNIRRKSGMMFLSVISDTVPFTLMYIFSRCENVCQHSTLSILAVYLCNVIFSIISLHITHDCQYKSDPSDIMIYFWLTTSIIAINWVSAVCITLRYFLTEMQFHRLRWWIRSIHAAQSIFIVAEFVLNGFGQNLRYILLSQSSAYTVSTIFLPFKAWDHSVYFENCILYFATNAYTSYVIYVQAVASDEKRGLVKAQ